GVCAGFFFRRLGCSPGLAAVGALAAALNMNIFSNVAWGLGTRATTIGLAFLAIGLLQKQQTGWRLWTSAALAGMAIGQGIMEGADNGAIVSVYIGAFVVFAFAVAGPQRSISKA